MYLIALVRTRGVTGGARAESSLGRPWVVGPLEEEVPLLSDAGAETEVERVEVAEPLTFVAMEALVRCGEEVAASSPTRLLFPSLFCFSGTSFIVDREGVDPKLGD